MATMDLILSGEVGKYKAELWDYNITVKKGDIPLDTVYTATGSDGTTPDVILLTPVSDDIIFDNYTDDQSLAMPWKPGLAIAKSARYPEGSRGIVLENARISNVKNAVSTFNVFWIGEPVTVIKFNRLHIMDNEALEDFSNARLVETGVDGEEIFNYSIYIINLLQINFELDPSHIGDNSTITLGELDTRIETPLLIGDSLSIDLGNISIPVSESSIDYLSNRFELFLPFLSDSIEISPSLCIGKTISVEYVVDMYLGDVTVNVFNGDDVPIISQKRAIGRNIPTKIASEMVNQITTQNGVDSGFLSAFIRHTKPEVLEGEFYNLISYSGSIGNYKGYLEVDSIDLVGGFITSEKNELLSILRSGVIVK